VSCALRKSVGMRATHLFSDSQTRPGVVNRRIAEAVPVFEELEVPFNAERHLQGRTCPDQHLVGLECSGAFSPRLFVLSASKLLTLT
jgi:hypothetical protein